MVMVNSLSVVFVIENLMRRSHSQMCRPWNLMND